MFVCAVNTTHTQSGCIIKVTMSMALLLLYKMYIYECGWNAHSDERKNHLTFIWVRARETSIRNILMEKSSKAMRQDNAHCTTYLYLYVGAIVVARIMHFLCANMMLDFVQLLFVYACMRGGNDVDVEALNFIYFTYICIFECVTI